MNGNVHYILLLVIMLSEPAFAQTSAPSVIKANDTLPAMTPETLPADIPALWADFDASKEPLETEVLYEYEKAGVTIQMVSYVVGTFKGQKVRMGGYLSYPSKIDGKLPGIVQIHGGGQRAMADYAAGIAQNGYAVLATNWGGRLMEHQEDGQPGEGKVGTDWSPLDATQKHNAWYANTEPDELTYDDFDSPRNNNWFLINLANKRAITFLQQLDFVDAEKIGVHGHSMGGKLSVMLAGTDQRIKVAVPSCGGTGAAPAGLKARQGNCARPQPLKPLYAKYIDDAQMLPLITCPIMYRGPQNDFNGMLSNLAFNWPSIPENTPVRFSITPHMNHRHALECEFVGLLMFEQYLKGTYQLPETPDIKVDLKGDERGPIIEVRPDIGKEVQRVEIFYSQDPNGQFRFRRSATVKKSGNVYTASAPITSTDLGFFAMANVYYKHPEELNLHGPRWVKNPATQYILSTNVQKFEISEVQKAQPAVTDVATRMIQKSFSNDGKPDWYHYSQNRLNTRKIRDPKWRGPIGAKLAVDILDPIGENLLLEFSFNSYSKYGKEFPTGEFYCVAPIKASSEWQTVAIDIADIQPKSATQIGIPSDWQTLDHLTVANRLDVVVEGNNQTFKSNSKNGSGRRMRNMRWLGGQYPQTLLMNGGGLELSPSEYEMQFSRQIDASTDLEEEIDGVKKSDDGSFLQEAMDYQTDNASRVYLTKEMATNVVSFWRVLNDQGVSGTPVKVGDKTFKRGLGVHAPSEITFQLDGRYESFYAVPAPDDAHRGDLEMKIVVDGQTLFTSGPASSGDGKVRKPVEIDLTNAKTLTLVVDDLGDRGGDHAVWADAYLINMPQKESP